MRKKGVWVLVVLIFTISMGLYAHGATETSTPKKEKLVIWTNLTADAQYTVLNKQFTELAQQMGIDVEVEKVAFNEMYAKLATAASSGNVPDIMHTNFGGTAYLYASESIMNLDEVIDSIGRNDFSDAYIRVLTGSDGKVYGLPDWAMHTSVWYRKDLFAQKGLSIPTTWADFKKTAVALNGDGISGFPVPLDGVQVAAQTLYEMMCSAGVFFIDPTTGEYCFDKEKDKVIDVINYLVDLYKSASPAGSLTWSWGDYRNALAVTGTVAMTLDMGAVIGNAQNNNPDMVGKLGCFDFPGVNGKKVASFGSGYCFVVSKQKDSSRKDLVVRFLKALYTPELAAERALSRPMFAFPSYQPAFEIYKKSPKVSGMQTEIAYIFDQYEHGTWYWYGMEHGLSAMSAFIESTTIFGTALQGACDGTYTAEQAFDLINAELSAYAKTL
jgi:multiple sugar transport system substrate-binding protein